VRTVLPSGIKQKVGKYFRKNIPNLKAFRGFFAGRTALEIGGPSGIFGDDGPMPIYRDLKTVDNCLYSSRTIWTGAVTEDLQFRYHPAKRAGQQFICDATNLGPIPSSSYECLVASHCLEHVANPLRALEEWKRCLVNGGLLLLVLPHKDGTFDWRRPTTKLSHMIQDYNQQIGEDDLTHLPEILSLHDLSRDRAAGSKEQFSDRCLNNYANRAIHHHVFNTLTAVELLDHAGFGIIRVNMLKPYHIIILARRVEQRPDNSFFMSPTAEYLKRSPFPSDR
jgi:SAM-dependent methyltransferase